MKFGTLCRLRTKVAAMPRLPIPAVQMTQRHRTLTTHARHRFIKERLRWPLAQERGPARGVTGRGEACVRGSGALHSRRSEALRGQHFAGAGGPRSCSVTKSNSAGRRARADTAVAEIA